MKRALAIVGFASAAFVAVSAMDITLRDGSQYSKIQLLEKTDFGIRIAHSSGVRFVDYLSMSPQDQFTFGYDEVTYKSQRSRLSETRTSLPQATGAPAYVMPVPSATPSDSSRGYAPKYSSLQASETPPNSAAASSGQCAGMTKKGYRCSRRARAGSAYCWQHGK